MFDRYLIPSYSQFGEDRLIKSILGNQSTGFYVDVGCNHPIAYSNTWQLYLSGWKGIAIDANPTLINNFRKVRPKDTAIAAVVSNHDETVEFYFSETSHLISGIGEKLEGHWQRSEDNSRIEKHTPIRLDEVLIKYDAPRDFDLLTIDTEGNELQVLQSLNFSQFKPRLIVVEIHDFNLSEPAIDPIYEMLIQLGYKLTGYANPSAFFLRGEQGG